MIAAVVAIVVVGGGTAARVTSGGGGESLPPIPSADGESVIPDFRLSVFQGEEVLGGGELQFSDVMALGKPVVLNFWAGLCPPCRAEMPGFQQVYENSRDDFVLLGVDVGRFTGLGSRRDGERLLADLGITYPIASVANNRSVEDYSVRSMPTRRRWKIWCWSWSRLEMGRRPRSGFTSPSSSGACAP
jgi:thiol-disulfide isomerase/thioredoxin